MRGLFWCGLFCSLFAAGCAAVLTACTKPDAPPVSSVSGQQQWFRIEGFSPVTPQQTTETVAACQRETNQALGDKAQMHRMIKTGDSVMDARSEEGLNLEEYGSTRLSVVPAAIARSDLALVRPAGGKGSRKLAADVLTTAEEDQHRNKSLS